MATSTHRWKFFRAGGVDQVVLRSGADIVNLGALDQKLWVALACPTRGIDVDQKTLDLLDTDKDGRIRAPEIVAAAQWLKEVLKDPDDLLAPSETLPLAAINEKTAAGAALLSGARRILQDLGKGDADAILLPEVEDMAKLFAATPFNGDGIVPAESATDEAMQKAIADVIATHGSVPDRSGKPGVNQALVDAFFADATALAEWERRAEADKAVLPLGAGTAAAAAAVSALKLKVDDYFVRCRLAAFDPRAAAALNGAEADFVTLTGRDLAAASPEVARLPIARIEAGRPLQLTDGVNPAWAGAVAELSRSAVAPLLGATRSSLTEAEWLALQDRLAPHYAWAATKPATKVDGLGMPRLRELLDGGAKGRIEDLLRQDLEREADSAQIAVVEKLLYFRRDFLKVLSNFVNFSEFYARKGAVFQEGTLYLDGRACNLCVRVEDAGKHAALAGLSKAYLAYCDCTRPGGAKLAVVAAFSNGDSDNLMVGRNGVFYDRKGNDWDATIVKIVENPISIRQAFWTPYKNFIRMVEAQVARRAVAADAEADARLKVAAAATATADQTRAPAAPKPEPKKIDIGTVAAIGVAVGGIATFLSSILATFFGLGMWMPLGLLVLLLAISGPSMLIAWLKLRQRNLGPILDANGWAVNGRVKINVPFGKALTSVAALPPGAERSVKDPYAEKRRPWRLYLALLLLLAVGVAWYLGYLDRHLPGHVRSGAVLGPYAPAATPADRR